MNDIRACYDENEKLVHSERFQMEIVSHGDEI